MSETRTERADTTAEGSEQPLSTQDIAESRTPRVDRNGVTGTAGLAANRGADERRQADELRQTNERREADESRERTAARAPETTAEARRPADDDRQSPLFDEATAGDLRQRWTDVQTAFVDEPRSAVEDADTLVADVMQRLADSFAKERKGLEGQWSRGDDVSTEELRLALQRYRSFFDRLLSI